MNLDADENADTDDPQIISGEYLITNNSNVPVLVGANTKLSAAQGSNVQIVTASKPTTDTNTKELTSNEGEKAIWMVQLLPTKAADLSAEEGKVLTVATLTGIPTSTTAAKDYKIIGGEDASAEVLFKLDANTGETMSPTCVSGFKFAGAVDPTKTFTEEDDVKVTTVFTLNVLSKGQKTRYKQLQGCDATVVEPVK